MMGLFRNMMRKKRNMRPNRMGMLAGLAGLKDRMRPARNMMFGGRRQLNPFLGMNNLPRKNRFLPPLSKLPPQPGGNRKFLDMIGGASSDIMPRDPGFGVNLPKPRPIMPDVQGPFRTSPVVDPNAIMNTQIQPQPSGPIRSVIEPVEGTIEPPKEDFSGYLDFYDNPPVPGMEDGGDVDKSEFPDLSGDGKITQKDILIGKGVIEMGIGGVVDNDADMMNIQRGRQEYQKFYFGLPEALRAGLPSPDEVYGDNQMSGDIDMMLQNLASPEKKSLNPPMMFR